MNWSSLTSKQKQMAVATAVLSAAQIVLMVHFLGWTKPASERGGASKTELYDLQQKIDGAYAIIKNEKALRDQMDESIERLENLAEYVPASADRYAWAYEFVSRCATQSGVTLDHLQESGFFQPADKNGPPPPYEISVSTRSGYSSLVQFLARLETSNPLLEIREVTIIAMRDIPLEHQVRVVMQWPASVKIEKGN